MAYCDAGCGVAIDNSVQYVSHGLFVPERSRFPAGTYPSCFMRKSRRVNIRANLSETIKLSAVWMNVVWNERKYYRSLKMCCFGGVDYQGAQCTNMEKSLPPKY
jgi:hypothetical protein